MQGKEICQTATTDMPSMLIGYDAIGPMDFTGTLFVNGDTGDDYIGVVFGYQSNRNFYVVMWRKANQNWNSYYAGIKGIQIKVRVILYLKRLAIIFRIQTEKRLALLRAKNISKCGKK